MSIDHVELHRLRGDLLRRPLNNCARHAALVLAECGIADETVDTTQGRALMQLADIGLAWVTARVENRATFVPTRLLSSLREGNRIGELEPRR